MKILFRLTVIIFLLNIIIFIGSIITYLFNLLLKISKELTAENLFVFSCCSIIPLIILIIAMLDAMWDNKKI